MSSENPDSPAKYVTDAVAKGFEDLPASSRGESAEKPPHIPPVNHIFNRERSLHNLLGGGKAADTFLWRNKLMSAGILGGASVIYLVLEHSGYTLMSILSYLLFFIFGVLFFWSNVAALLNRSPPPFPDFHLSEDEATSLALTIRQEVNKVIAVLHDLATGKDYKLFLKVAAVLWGLSIVGGWFHFLTLVYLAVVASHTIPAVYERYEDQVDYYATRAYEGAQSQYRTIDEKYLQKAYEGAQNKYRTIDENYLQKLPIGIPKAKKAE